MKPEREENPEVTCSVCGVEAARAVRRPQVISRGANLIVVENVPMFSCRNCGHTYFSVQVARTLDEIRRHPEQYTEPREVAVAEFA
jgi:YgiT-type zinc finger domain-containing protein